jgi:prepilin-type processing-associated H-X9-DG protein
MSNIRQLQVAAMQYATDHDDRYPPGARDIHQNLHRWHGTRASTGEAFDPSHGPLTSYLGSDALSVAMRECPTFAPVARELRSRGDGFETGCGGYGYNNAFVGVVRERKPDGTWTVASDATGSRSTRFAAPSRTIGFTDAALLTDAVIEYSFAEPRLWPDAPQYAPDPSVHFRHGGEASVAWLDGHVSSERMSQTVDGWYSEGHSGEAGLGWFGTETSNELYDYR